MSRELPRLKAVQRRRRLAVTFLRRQSGKEPRYRGTLDAANSLRCQERRLIGQAAAQDVRHGFMYVSSCAMYELL